ncbi:MAG: LEPR-XLL domain-containing protein, partial [Verrucomicrobiota bacterium]
MKNTPSTTEKKNSGFLERLFGTESRSERECEKLMLETLEPRVLYSAAPVESPPEAPVEETVHVASPVPDPSSAPALATENAEVLPPVAEPAPEQLG